MSLFLLRFPRQSLYVAVELRLQNFDQRRVCIPIAISDTGDDDFLVSERGAERFLQAALMDLFHGEDDVRPFDEVEEERIVRIGLVPAEAVWMFGCPAKTASAGGLRSRLRLHTNNNSMAFLIKMSNPVTKTSKSASVEGELRSSQ